MVLTFTLGQVALAALVFLPQPCGVILASPVASPFPQTSNCSLLSRILIITTSLHYQRVLYSSPLPEISGVTLCQGFLSVSNCHVIFLSEWVFFQDVHFLISSQSMVVQEKQVDREQRETNVWSEHMCCAQP